MKTIRIQNNWLVKAIKSGVLNVSDIPYNSLDEKAKIDAILSEIKVYWKDASKSLLSNMIIPSEEYYNTVKESTTSFIKSDIFVLTKENDKIRVDVNYRHIKGESCCMFLPKHNYYFVYVFRDDYAFIIVIQNDYIIDIQFSSIRNDSYLCLNTLSDKNYSSMVFTLCAIFALFEKYAQIETKTIVQGKKLTTSKGRIKNESIAPFKYRTSRYYTRCIRNDDFKVSGHMRFQPCKDENGDWTHKLIYIKEFLKHGYHRSAEIEKKVS